MLLCYSKLIINHFLSSDWKLKLVFIKMESLVIVDQDVTVNLYLDLVHTARHMLEVCFTRKLHAQNKWKLILLADNLVVGHTCS